MRSILTAAAALALGLAACGQPAEQADAPATAAPAMAEAGSADAFARGLYADVGSDGFSSLTDEAGPRIWSASTWSKIEAAAIAAGDEMGPIDFEPLCHCQDNTGLRLISLDTVSTGPTTADARVALGDEGGGVSGLTLKLVQEAGGWKVDDMQPDGDPGVLNLLGEPG